MIGSECIQFDITHRDARTRARRGLLKLPHGVVETPLFLPVGTQGAVKAITPRDLEEVGTSMILANTYHLALRPGADVVREAGGLHSFMAWSGPILTDSGGFQVFSLATLGRVDEEGVTFRSHIDGDSLQLTPERSVEIQNALGADIIMAFDECVPAGAERHLVERAANRTSQWAERSVQAHRREDQALFGIVQGGVHEDLRRMSAQQITALDFPGYAVGGVAVGETPEEMRGAVDTVEPLLPAGKPRYLMGVGEPGDIVDMVGRGMDIFDCVIPTRHARNASLFTRRGVLKMRNLAFVKDFAPIEDGCDCYACRRFARAYLRHLYTRNEMLGGILGTIHNLRFFQRLMEDLRRAIRENRFVEFRESCPRFPLPSEGEEL